MTSRYIFENKVRIYRRENSSVWQAQARFNGQKFRVSTKTDNLSKVKQVAEEWHFELRGKEKAGLSTAA